MLLDDRFVEAQREDVVAQLSARHKEQSSHELHSADSSWVGALQSQAPRVALSSWGNGTALAMEPPPHCCSHCWSPPSRRRLRSAPSSSSRSLLRRRGSSAPRPPNARRAVSITAPCGSSIGGVRSPSHCSQSCTSQRVRGSLPFFEKGTGLRSRWCSSACRFRSAKWRSVISAKCAQRLLRATSVTHRSK